MRSSSRCCSDITPVAIYETAKEMLLAACDALDQAHAAMRDAGLERIVSVRGTYSLEVKQLAKHAELLYAELETAECEHCGHALELHRGSDCDEAYCECRAGLSAPSGIRRAA